MQRGRGEAEPRASEEREEGAPQSWRTRLFDGVKWGVERTRLKREASKVRDEPGYERPVDIRINCTVKWECTKRFYEVN